ncbi:hypothetical protein BDY21DRAFT_374824 [Lineolata rhizophorae]|uniref:SprT-like domain-containing protein n=1 Tax=Lineolata rhizophorae TaxID=578093 RepID=A0A6A6NQ25_9PEZI|nr:hypothetical protein BDY21DRAFT_374824 [Lineolata rhizophorae]
MPGAKSCNRQHAPIQHISDPMTKCRCGARLPRLPPDFLSFEIQKLRRHGYDPVDVAFWLMAASGHRQHPAGEPRARIDEGARLTRFAFIERNHHVHGADPAAMRAVLEHVARDLNGALFNGYLEVPAVRWERERAPRLEDDVWVKGRYIRETNTIELFEEGLLRDMNVPRVLGALVHQLVHAFLTQYSCKASQCQRWYETELCMGPDGHGRAFQVLAFFMEKMCILMFGDPEFDVFGEMLKMLHPYKATVKEDDAVEALPFLFGDTELHERYKLTSEDLGLQLGRPPIHSSRLGNPFVQGIASNPLPRRLGKRPEHM